MNGEAGERLAGVRRQIAAAEVAAGRPAGEVTLIAVSKTFGTEVIAPVIEAGQMHFGENRVQGGVGQMAGAESESSGHRAAPDRAVAIQQGAGCSGAVRRHPHDRPR